MTNPVEQILNNFGLQQTESVPNGTRYTLENPLEAINNLQAMGYHATLNHRNQITVKHQPVPRHPS